MRHAALAILLTIIAVTTGYSAGVVTLQPLETLPIHGNSCDPGVTMTNHADMTVVCGAAYTPTPIPAGGQAPCSYIAANLSPTGNQPVGTVITHTSSAVCPEGSVPEFRVYLRRYDGGIGPFVLFRDWTQTAAITWDTTGSLAEETYQFVEQVRHVGGTDPDAQNYASVYLSAPTSPTPTPTRTPTPAPVSMIEGVPVCTDHDATKWHPLVRRNGNTILCTYGHEHHADPNSVNDIFGPPGAWYGGTQEISYPWQTFSTLGQENTVKHEGYKWFVARNQTCAPFWSAPNDGCMRSWRVLVHSMGSASDVTVRFHSYSIEMQIDYHGQIGVIRHGGWADFGHLALAEAGGHTQCPPITSNPPPPFACGGEDNHRLSSSANLPAPFVNADVNLSSWYSSHHTTQISFVVEEWGATDYTDPSHQMFHDPSLNRNNSFGSLGNMFFNGASGDLGQYVNANGFMTASLYTNRAGDPVTGCSAPGIDCVPLQITNAHATAYAWNSGTQNDAVPMTLLYPDWDVLSPVTGKSLIRFPN